MKEGWTGQENNCMHAVWWDCSFLCCNKKLNPKKKLFQCKYNVPNYKKCEVKEKMLPAKKELIKLNPSLKDKRIILRGDGRVEFICKHGIGHTIYYPKGSSATHGCDGCCKDIKCLNEDDV
jgi:hypothetical protein